MNPWHINRHEKIVAYLCRHFDLPEHMEAEVNASHEHGCEEYGEWNHHRPEFDGPREMGEELEDTLGLIAFEYEPQETGDRKLTADELAELYIIELHVAGALKATARLENLRDSKARDAREAS